MANRTFYPAASPVNEMKVILCTFTTNNTSDPTVFTANEIASVTNDSVGDFTVTLAHTYPSIEQIHLNVLQDGNEDFIIKARTKTANSFTCTVLDGATPTDTTGMVIQCLLFVKNSTV